MNDLSKRYGPRWALAKISFRLEHNKTLLLTGHNGSGKSTLLRILATATRPTLGSLSLFGAKTHHELLDLRHRVVFISHQTFHYDDLSAFENVRLFSRIVSKDISEKMLDAALERVGLAQRKHSRVREFSAGMKRRLALTRVVLKKPSLALFDEPFSELDPQGIALAESIVRELKSNGCTLVISTHQVEHGLTLCDERLHLKNGHIAQVSS